MRLSNRGSRDSPPAPMYYRPKCSRSISKSTRPMCRYHGNYTKLMLDYTIIGRWLQIASPNMRPREPLRMAWKRANVAGESLHFVVHMFVWWFECPFLGTNRKCVYKFAEMFDASLTSQTTLPCASHQKVHFCLAFFSHSFRPKQQTTT